MIMQGNELNSTLYKPSYFNGFEKTKRERGQKNFKKLATNVLQICVVASQMIN